MGVDELKRELAALKQRRNITTCIYTLGVSRSHDAQLLNSVAQAGSELGNFIYIDNYKADFQQDMVDAVQESLGMAAVARKRNQGLAKIQIMNPTTGLDQQELCEIIYNYDEGEAQDELYERAEEGVDPAK